MSPRGARMGVEWENRGKVIRIIPEHLQLTFESYQVRESPLYLCFNSGLFLRPRQLSHTLRKLSATFSGCIGLPKVCNDPLPKKRGFRL